MTNADHIYREMLINDAQKCRYPRLATFAVKHLGWVADDRFFIPFITLSFTILLLTCIGIIATLAYITIETFFTLP